MMQSFAATERLEIARTYHIIYRPEPLKQACRASYDVMLASQICGSNLQRWFVRVTSAEQSWHERFFSGHDFSHEKCGWVRKIRKIPAKLPSQKSKKNHVCARCSARPPPVASIAVWLGKACKNDRVIPWGGLIACMFMLLTGLFRLPFQQRRLSGDFLIVLF